MGRYVCVISGVALINNPAHEVLMSLVCYTG